MKLYQNNFVQKVLKNAHIMFAVKTVMYLAFVLVYYLDILKDILLARRLHIFWGDDLPLLLFVCTVSSIILGEVANIFVLLNSKVLAKHHKITGVMLIPFAPAFITYRIYKLEVKLEKQIRAGERQEKQIGTWLSLQELRKIQSVMRANENVLEHLPQLVILLLLIFIKSSKDTTTVPLHLSSNLVPENAFLFIASAVTSFFSIIRGQLSNVVAKKNGFLPSLGKLALFVYYTVGIGARVVAILLFFTPFPFCTFKR